jgi:hypothetical protein
MPKPVVVVPDALECLAVARGDHRLVLFHVIQRTVALIEHDTD